MGVNIDMIYWYRCNNTRCNHEFSVVTYPGSNPVACPKCHSDNVTRCYWGLIPVDMV